MTRGRTAYIVFDIETIPDGKLIADVLYPGLNLSAAEAIERQEKEVEEQTAGRSTFVPCTFQVPVAIGVARVGSDYRLQKLALLDAPEFRVERMVELFWKGLDSYPDATLVDFGGRGFDLPVLELAAFRHGIAVPSYFSANSRAYRHRYGERHIDLLDWFTNWGAYRIRGGLDLLAKMLGTPGKMEVRGEQVHELWQAGKKDVVGSYCLCDVLDTYLVFLRTRVLTGEITPEGERAIVEHARSFVDDLAFEDAGLEEYLARWGPLPARPSSAADRSPPPPAGAEPGDRDPGGA